MSDWPGLLPAGLHPMELDAIERLCVAPWPDSISRANLHAGLRRFAEALRGMGLTGQLWLDGSFLTQKPSPADVDCVLVPDLTRLEAAMTTHAATLEEWFAMGGAKALFLCDAFLCLPQDAHRLAYWRGWFGFSRDGLSAKGIAILSL